MLKLTRPVIFFDLETTGVDLFNDRIVQIAAVKYFPDGSKKEYNQLINPNIPISPESTSVHKITNEMVKDKPFLGDIATELAELFDSCDLGGYNIKFFDIPMLQNEFQRIGLTLNLENIKIVDAMAIFKLKEPRTLSAAYEKYCGKKLIDAHDALADTRASIEVLEGQINFYQDLPDTVEAIHNFCFPFDPNAYDAEGKLRYINGELAINFGKNKGRTLRELSENDPGYLQWILNGSFTDKVKEAVRKMI